MCPMLVRCKECSQVVEVATLMEHLLMECEHRENYTQCSQCTEAVKLEDYENHGNSCIGKHYVAPKRPILLNCYIYRINRRM